MDGIEKDRNADDQPFSLRRADATDADAVAAVFTPSYRQLDFLPTRHGVDQDRWFIANVILRECDVTVAAHDGRIVAFLALDGDEMRLLHTHPDWQGQGAGSKLVEAAKQMRPNGLELWCFQANRRARRFYEDHGFTPVEFTDGHRNEEKTPDLRYRWDGGS